MYEKELHEEITKLWDDPDFANGALCYLDTDEQRKKVLDGIRSEEIVTSQDVFGYVMELAGFCERVD